MCYRPLHIRAHNAYINSNVSACTYDVPCGHCESCRDSYRSMWKCRLWHELDALYKRGGRAVFLTFTYRDSCLPTIDYNGITIPVFNRDDVKLFLNRLKVRAYRMFGKSSYKYFIAMEYGKNTKRQHLHGLFFLESFVDWVKFVELCRSLWPYGFMFPKRSYGRYIKDDGSDDTPLLRDAVKGSVYVSKYVTKDVSFYEIPSISSILKTDASFLRPYLPKHYQSNNLGISILDKIDTASLDKFCDTVLNGVSVPYSKSRIPLPRYIVKKLLYENIPSSRIGIKGNILYDSVPTSLCLTVRSLLYERKASKLVDSVKKVFARYASLVPSAVVPSVDYSLLANYILYFRNVNNNVLHSFLTYYDGDIESFSDFSKVGFFYNLSKDNSFLKDSSYLNESLHTFPYSDVFSSSFLDAYRLYLVASSYCQELQVSEFKKRSDEREHLRSKYQYTYPKNLC